MKQKLTIVAVMVFATTVLAQSTSLTITNRNLGLVRDTRSIELAEGQAQIDITGIPALIDPTSLYLSKGSNALQIVHQAYCYDLLDMNTLLTQSIDKEIEILADGSSSMSGRLVHYDGANLIVESNDGYLNIIPRSSNQQIRIKDREAIAGLVTKPTLCWTLGKSKSGKIPLEMSYTTQGLNWRPEYSFVIAENEKKAELSAWVNVSNNSGMDFNNVGLNLLAGDINLVQGPGNRPMMARAAAYDAMAKSEMSFSQQELMDFYLYKLDGTVTLPDGKESQLRLLDATTVSVDRVYAYDNSKDADNVSVQFQFLNDKTAGTGQALPAGRVRMYKRTGSGIEFVGEDMISHTAVDERVELETGKAFDIAVTREITERKRISKNSEQQHISIELRNHKKEDIKILVTEPQGGYRSFEIVASNFPVRKKTVNQIDFEIPVKASSTVTLQLDILYSW
jgi:hypothetical protein